MKKRLPTSLLCTVTFLLLCHFSFGFCGDYISITKCYRYFDIAVKGSILEVTPVDSNRVLKVLIDIEVDYKSDCEEIELYLIKNQPFEVGDQIIVLTPSEINTPEGAKRNNWFFITNVVLLKREDYYAKHEAFEAAQKAFEYAENTIIWASQFNTNPKTCDLGFSNKISAYNLRNVSHYDPSFSSDFISSDLVHLMIAIKDGQVTDYYFAEGTSLENIKRIESLGIDAPCVLEYGIRDAQIPVSLLVIKERNLVYRI